MFEFFFATSYGERLNIAACVAVLFMSLTFDIRVSSSLRQLRRDDPQEGKKHRYLDLAATIWTYAWVAWVALYVVRALVKAYMPAYPMVEFSTLALSDINSALFCYMAWLLRCGSESVEDSAVARRVLLLGMLLTFAVGLVFLYFGELALPGDHSTVFWRLWSVSLAAVSAFLLGRSFKNRYGTNTVWAFATAYALAQILAYGAGSSAPGARERTVDISITESAFEGLPEMLRKEHIVRSVPMSMIVPMDPANQTGASTDDPVEGKVEPKYSVKMWRDSGPIKQEWIDDVIEAASISPLSKTWIRLHLESIVYSLLAILKLCLGATIIAQLRAFPAHESNTVTCHRAPTPNQGIIGKEWKIYYFGMIFILSVMLITITIVHKSGLSLLAIPGGTLAFVGAVVWITSGGKTISDLLGPKNHPPHR